MSPVVRPIQTALICILLASTGSASGSIQILGPDQLPSHLQGLWKISLCGTSFHTWIRYQNTETGEVHTISRYNRGRGGMTSSTGKQIWPSAPVTGVIWDIDLKYEPGISQGKYILRSCYVRNPRIYRGIHQGRGHLCLYLNCTSHARNAWNYYTGEQYCLFPVSAPWILKRAVERRNRRQCRSGCCSH